MSFCMVGVLVLIVTIKGISGEPQWRFANGPYAAAIQSLAINPAQPDIIYAVGGGGVFKSQDEGKTWTSIEPHNGLQSYADRSPVVLDPHNPEVIYLGANGGLFRSTDAGTNWKLIGFAKREVLSFAIDPVESNVIYVGLDFAYGDAIWKSTDGGQTWQVKNLGIPPRDTTQGTNQCYAITINPQNRKSLFASVPLDGVFESKDGGENWRYVAFKGAFIHEIAFAPWDTTVIFAVGNFTGSGVLKSINGGATWRRVLYAGTTSIEIDQLTKKIYVGTWGSGIFRSTDVGESWTPLNNPKLPTSFSMAMDVNDVAVDPNAPNHIYLGTEVGPYKSTDGGQSWQQSFDGMDAFFAFAIQIAPSNPSIICATGLPGVHRSTDGGASWRYIGGAGTFSLLAIAPSDPKIIYVSQAGLDITHYFWRTTNGGISWAKLPISSPTYPEFLQVDPNAPNIVYTSVYDGLLRSADWGNTWEKIPSPVSPKPPTSLAVVDKTSQVMYLGTPQGVYKTTDGAKSWTSLGLSNFDSRMKIALDPQNSQTIYAAVYGHGFFKSTDHGQIWTEKNNNLSDKSVFHLVVNAKNPSGIFLGTRASGIFHSTNAGEEWTSLHPSPPFLRVDALVIDTTSTGRIFASGRPVPGVYVLDSVTSVSEEQRQDSKMKSYVLAQNYPNPFNPSTVIEYFLASSGEIRLEIYDLLGRKIRTMVNGYQVAGRHQIMWDGRNDWGETLGSGVYTCRLISKAAVRNRKMLLIH